MATIIVHTRVESKKGCIDALNAHLDYLKDPTHDDHAGLTLHPGKNYGCGPTAADFVEAVESTQKKCLEVCDSKSAKCFNEISADIWEELVNDMGEGCYQTADEREVIEKKIIEEICPGSPARAVWLDNPVTGEGSLRIIFPTKNSEGKPNLERNKALQQKRMQALDQQVANILNTSGKTEKKKSSRPPERWKRTA